MVSGKGNNRDLHGMKEDFEIIGWCDAFIFEVESESGPFCYLMVECKQGGFEWSIIFFKNEVYDGKFFNDISTLVRGHMCSAGGVVVGGPHLVEHLGQIVYIAMGKHANPGHPVAGHFEVFGGTAGFKKNVFSK